MGSQTRVLLTSFFSLVGWLLLQDREKRDEEEKESHTKPVVEGFRQNASQLMMRGIQTIDLHV